MSTHTPPFLFVDDIGHVVAQSDFHVEIPPGIQSQAELFLRYEKAGHFPGYFGRNWDALLDCLRDFSWTELKRIVITHEDLPLANNEAELRIYLEILETAVSDWQEVREGTFAEAPREMPYVQHELLVVFPAAVRSQVDHIL
jgi:RNAse (barnase) inhibitor barstar